jgi:methyl-CpG-binding domain protein 4
VIETNWQPPKSPVGMLQESMWPDTWKILVACILHNQTRRKQVDKVYVELFDRYPTPQCMAEADPSDLSRILQPLGFQNRRGAGLVRFSQDYVSKQRSTPKELHGCGKYAEDCYRVFCLGDWRTVQPTDHKLNDYVDWLHRTDGGVLPDAKGVEHA